MHVLFDVGLSGKDVVKYKKSKVKKASTYPAVEQGQTFPVWKWNFFNGNDMDATKSYAIPFDIL